MSTPTSPAEQKPPHSQVQASVPKFEKCTTQAQFRKVLYMVNGIHARLSSNKDNFKIDFADWKRDLLRDLSTAISRSANGFESQQKQKKGGSKFKLEFEIISWISCGRSLQVVLEKMQEAQIEKTNWTLTKLFTRLIGDEHLALRNEIIEAQEKKKVDVDLLSEFGEAVRKATVKTFFMVPAETLCKQIEILDDRMKPLRATKTFKRSWTLALNRTWSVYLTECVLSFSQKEDNVADESFLQHLGTACMCNAKCREIIGKGIRPSPIELWEAANALRPEHLRLDSASEAHSLRRLLNRRQRLIYGF